MKLTNMISALALAVLAVGQAMPLAAQMTGSRLGKNASADDAQGVLDVMVECVGNRKPEYAEKIMNRMPGSQTERELIFGNEGDLAMCMNDKSRRLVLPDNAELTMTARQFRIGLSRVLAQRSLRRADPSKLGEAPAWSTDMYLADEDDATRSDRLLLGLYYFGDCVVVGNPRASAEFVVNGPSSDKGKQALKVLMPTLGPCLTEGAEINLTPESLVVALAEPIYHRIRRHGSGG